jgi:hypothetical protein
MIVSEAEKLLMVLYFTGDSYVCQWLSLEGVLHGINSFDVKTSKSWNTTIFPAFMQPRPTGYGKSYYVSFCVSDHSTNEPVETLTRWCSRQTLLFNRPDQKLIIDRSRDAFHIYDTSLTWKSVDYSLVQHHGNDRVDNILLKIEKEGDADMLVELQPNSKHGLIRSTLAHLPVFNDSTLGAERAPSVRLLGNEMYVVVFKAGCLSVLYFDPDVDIKPDHLQF